MVLNGWQRLLVVLCVGWILIMGFAAVAVWIDEGRGSGSPAEIQAERIGALVLVAATTLLVPALLYGAFVVVRWIIRGFKQSAS